MDEESEFQVNREPCDCGYLERSAADANTPVRYDPELNEYHIIYALPGSGHGVLMIYYCPMCGGSAPQSRREALFAEIPPEEAERIGVLVDRVANLDDVATVLGVPDEDDPVTLPEGMVWPSNRDSSPELPVKILGFVSLSQVADVRVSVYVDGRAHATFHAKYIGPRQEHRPR